MRCIARNNFITRAPEAGIVTVYTADCKLLNNTIHDPESRLRRLLRTVFTNDRLVIADNLLSGPGISSESDIAILFSNNLMKDMTDYFVNPDEGNLHLSGRPADVIDAGLAQAQVTGDIDRQPRGAKPDIGADEVIN